jgi:parvulin-like peptidyl-prolyl isomerase
MRFIRLLIALFICQLSLAAQSNNDIIAKIGNISISKKEFMERYEFVPQMGREQKGINENLRMEILYTMIAEKIWAAEAEKINMDTIPIIKNTIKEYEKIFVRDALFNREIKAKAELDAEQYLGAYLSLPSYVIIKYLSSESESRIQELAGLLKSGRPFDSLSSSLNGSGEQEAKFQIGDLPENEEKIMFSLKPGETGPYFKLDSLWLIYKVESRGEPYSTFVKPNDETFLRLKKTAFEKAVNKNYREYRNRFFKGKKVDTDGAVFKAIARNIYSVLAERKGIADSLKEKIFLTYDDFVKLREALSQDTLKMNYVRFEEEPVSTDDYIKYLLLENFSVDARDLRSIVNALNAKNREFIEREMLTREGYKLKLQETPDVKYWMNVWKGYMLSEAFQTKFRDSAFVSDEQLKDYYHRRYEKAADVNEVNIIEILTDSLSIVEKVFNELKKGKDFKELARLYTKRERTKENGGEFGFFATTMYEDIGKIAEGMEIGQIYGPLKTPEGYSVFKVIGKRTRKVTEIKQFDAIKNDLKKDLSYNKYRNSLINFTARKAAENNLEINEDMVKNTEVTNLNVMVYRFIGFGGRLPAMPLIKPFTDWVEMWNKIKKQSL